MIEGGSHHRQRWWFAVALLAAAGLRLALLPFWTVDQRDFLIPWLHHAEASGAGYLAAPFTNYTPAYEHAIALLALLPGPAMLRIKLLSIVFDVVLAALVAAIAPEGRRRLGFSLMLLMPTVMLNSAAWGQCDAIYASFTLLALLCAVKGRPAATALAFGMAIAFKLQAAIFAPVLLLLTLERRQPLWTWLLVPLPYLLVALPMLAAGRSWYAIAFVYDNQFNAFHQLALVAPNPWIVFNKLVDYRTGLLIGLPLAAAAVGAIVLALHRLGTARTEYGLLLAVALIAVAVPFVTPKMHERFFYLADPVLILLVCRDGRNVVLLALAETASLLAYIPFTAISTDPDGPIYRAYIWAQEHWGAGFGILALPGCALMAVTLALLAQRVWALRAVPVARALEPAPTPAFA
jgi:Gpi18-like mannosyltransferase